MKNFDIVGHRKWWFCLSGLLVLIALICIIVKGFNFGIDFTGGTILDLKFAQPVTVAQVRTGLEPDGLQSSVIQLSGDTHEESGREVIIRTRSLSSEEAQTIASHISAKVGKAEINRVETVGAVIGSEVTRNTILNVGLSFTILIIYMSIRFEHRIAFSAIAAIVHDIIVVLGVFALFHLEIDASFLAAILTVLGYSMNESVVIFDRIRENRQLQGSGQRFYPPDFPQKLLYTDYGSFLRSLSVLLWRGNHKELCSGYAGRIYQWRILFYMRSYFSVGYLA